MVEYRHRGNIKLLDSGTRVAIVGSRKASEEGLAMAHSLAAYLAKKGFIIVSGLAEGIDSAAHKGCLGVKGKTIAVLGTGLDFIYPIFNKKLAKEIVEEGGLLLSMYEDSFSGSKWSYPERNKIVVEISEAVMVIEASIKSGTMITVKEAIKKGKEVWVWSGSVSEGNKYLIENGMGKAFTRASEIKVR